MLRYISLRTVCLGIFASTLLLLSGCQTVGELGSKVGIGGDSPPVVRIKYVAVKMIFAAGQAALQVALDELSGAVGVDPISVRNLVVAGDIQNGLPPGDIAVLMVVHKKTNQVQYWRLTKNVKMIRLKSSNPGPIELKVVNENPLRVELWLEGDAPEVDVVVELLD